MAWRHRDQKSDDLHRAMRSKGLRNLVELINSGLDVRATYDGGTLLHCASETIRPDFARVLLKHGADVNARNQAGNTPIEVMPETFMGAGYARGLELARLLLENKADMNPSGIFWNKKPLLHWALEGSGQYPKEAKSGVYENALVVVRMLIERGADIESVDMFGFSPLDYAITHGHEDAIRLLLDNGVDCSKRLKDDMTPMECAINYHGNESKVAQLVHWRIKIRDNTGE